jgi:hypothetical protein
MNLRVSVSLVAVVLAVGCEKSGPSAVKGSGTASGSEKELLASLPGGNTVLFGGNYMRFQKFLETSPLASMISKLDTQAPGLSEWTTCWVEHKDIAMLGGVKIAADNVDMRFVMKGIDLPAIEKCAERAKFPATVDPDKKFIALEIQSMGRPMKTGYLVLPNGAVYSRQAMPMSNPQGMLGTDRASLEADVAGLATSNAGGDAKLIAQMDGVDRKKAMWFVGSAEGTPVADKVGTVAGSLDIAPGLSLDVTAQVKDKQIADKISEGVPEAKKQAKALGPDLAAVVEGLQFTRDGDKLRFVISISDAQLKKIMEQLGPMMGGMGH